MDLSPISNLAGDCPHQDNGVDRYDNSARLGLLVSLSRFLTVLTARSASLFP